MEENSKKNIKHICDLVKKGEIFPINLYHYKVKCKCEDAEINLYGDNSKEEFEKANQKCFTCNSTYQISEGLFPTETATFLFLNKSDDDRMPAFMLASCTPEVIEQIALAGNWIKKNKSYLLPKIQRKVNLFGSKK
jgi:hypothetical protein